jgi:hypothetical protein
MNSKQQSDNKVNEVKMIGLSPAFWLNLLGDKARISPSANGRNGQHIPWQVVTDRSEMTDYSPELWLRLLGGTANNGSGPKANLTSSPVPDQQFTTKFWLRLLGDRGGES